uniref:R3H-assoc domain-containing protein n=1 Tax=Haemonchus contortus TaxID=6289 RepID=A0A7I4Y930_HAECO
MGVTRRFDHLRPINVEEEVNDIIDRFNYADFDFSESDTEEAAICQNDQISDMFPASRSRKNKERRAERKMRRFLDLENSGAHSKNAGARKQRQQENVRVLMSYVDKEDICTDFSDIVPHTVTPFEKLFIDRENMQIWNDFIERDEEEQRQILNNEESSSGCGWFIVGGSSSKTFQGVDGRKRHPAYCGKACFQRMDGKSKRLLSGKRLPWAFIDRLEGELLSFFCSSSPGAADLSDDAVYVCVFENSLERALGHAIAQYLMLKSKSVTDRGSGERLTEFRNPRAFFIPPRIRLIPFLSSLRPEPIDFPSPSKCDEGHREKEESPDSSFSDIYPNHIGS